MAGGGTQAKTERGSFGFAVKEFGDGTPLIVAEPLRESMAMLKEAFIGFDLAKGTTLQKAQEIADYMNRYISGLSITVFESHPMFKSVK